MEYCIGASLDGLCIRSFLRSELHLSSKMIKTLKYRSGGITVNGEEKTVRYLLREGDLLSLASEDPVSSSAVAPVDLPLPILYENDDIVIPVKPADMPTHPSHDHYTDTVANALAFRYAESGIPFVFRPINRLDRNTSGLLLIARNKIAAGKLTRAMQDGEIRKTYLAILDGEMEETEGLIDVCLHRTADSIIVRETCLPDAPDADRSVTTYRVLAVGNGHTLVSAHPLTGRTHQLRVHFSSLGFPITGDDLYGTPSDDIPRHALHARSLSFPSPSDGAQMTFFAPLATDFERLLHLYFPSFVLPDGV